MPTVTVSPLIQSFLAAPNAAAARAALVIDDIPSVVNFASNYTVPVPGVAPAAGDTQLLHVTSAAGGDLTFDPAIGIPSDSPFTGTKPLTAGELYIVKLQYSGTFWMLVSLVGGYA